VFLCFFIGNDFLPRVFCMDIKIGNFDILISIFKEFLAESDGYINQKGVICWYRAVKLFKKIAEFELKFIGDKLEEQTLHQRATEKTANQILGGNEEVDEDNDEAIRKLEKRIEDEELGDIDDVNEDDFEEDLDGDDGDKKPKAKKKKALKNPKLAQRSVSETTKEVIPEIHPVQLEPAPETKHDPNKFVNEEAVLRLLSAKALEKDIKFMEEIVKAYKEEKSEARRLYYKEKFNVDVNKNPQELTKILTVYMQGLQFVLSYYYTNCPSWTWFYSYYYSPLISDLSDLMVHL
jgi:5'-3' exoribonuclease 1